MKNVFHKIKNQKILFNKGYLMNYKIGKLRLQYLSILMLFL